MLASVEWHVVWERLFHPDHVFVRALWTTIYIAVTAQVLGVVAGLARRAHAHVEPRTASVALRLLRAHLPRNAAAGPAVLHLLRHQPAVPGIFFDDLIPTTANFGLFTLDGAIIAGILALGINEGAYMREIIRAGIDAIDKGQMEAARSLGMTQRLAMRRIVLPQAARVIVPPLGNEFNAMLKNTSLVFTIGVYEMFSDAEIHYSTSFLPVEYFGAVAIWYLVLTTIWTLIQSQIERKLAASERGEELTLWERLTDAWTPMTAWARGAR